MLRLVEANLHHIDDLEGNLRIEDQRELEAAGNTLKDCYDHSQHTFSILHRQSPIALWGYSKYELGCVPWFLGTYEVLNHIRPLLFLGHSMAAVLLEKYSRLFNVVHEDNERHIRWLSYMGFSLVPINAITTVKGEIVDNSDREDPDHYPYIYFYKERF